MSETINRDAMRLAIQLYAARIEEGDSMRAAQSAAVEDARELILARRKLQRMTNANESQQIFYRVCSLMEAYGITVKFSQTPDGPMGMAVTLDHESFGKIAVPS